MPRRPLLAGNWKMNPSRLQDASDLAAGVATAAEAHRGRVDTAVFPPTVWLQAVASRLAGTPVAVGAQDCYWERSGAYTGATAAAMLAGWCDWTLVGHSERREYFGMTDDDVARSAAAAVGLGVAALICVGEQLADYQAGRTRDVVTAQVKAALSRIGDHPAEIAFAYEPVWAIGSGRTPEPGQVGEVLDLIRDAASERLGAAGRTLRVLYGGSVKPDNVAGFLEVPACDGALVGGASLQPNEFATMLRTAEEVTR